MNNGRVALSSLSRKRLGPEICYYGEFDRGEGWSSDSEPPLVLYLEYEYWFAGQTLKVGRPSEKLLYVVLLVALDYVFSSSQTVGLKELPLYRDMYYSSFEKPRQYAVPPSAFLRGRNGKGMIGADSYINTFPPMRKIIRRATESNSTPGTRHRVY